MLTLELRSSRRRRSGMKLTEFALLLSGLVTLLGACSDDGDKPNPDTMAPDGAVADVPTQDGVTPPDGVVTEGAVPDVTPTPDQMLIPSDWTEVLGSTAGKIHDVFGLGPKQVYVVGAGGLIMTYDGTTWNTMNNPETSDLHGLWGNASKLFAVGNSIDLVYDGSSWSTGTSTTSYSFRDVWGGTASVFAVGEMGGYIRYRSFTSTYWSSVYTYSITTDAMYGVQAFSDSEVYVVGDNGLILVCKASCNSSSASNWTQMTSNTTSNLRAIWGPSGSDLFAVGFDGTILRYNGTSWSKMSTGGTSTYFQGVWGSGPSDVWAVGHPIFKNDESIYHFDGTSWTKTPPPRTSFLNAVWGSGPSDVWAVGNYNVLHYTGPKP
jgi:photosystem II stability/assembly factor-like uncharacterized protein